MEILTSSRNELYLNFPYLDVALCGLVFRPGGEVTGSLAADGESLYYNTSWLSDRYLRSDVLVNRAYLHLILHCMLRHLEKKRGKVPELWDLACDVAVESILDELKSPCLKAGTVPMKQNVYNRCRRKMPVLTAEGIYRQLLEVHFSEYELAKLQRAFLADDHGLWAPKRREEREKSRRQDQKWRETTQRTQTGMETVLAGQAVGGDAIYEQVKVENRQSVDYRKFLQRFAVPREVLGVDGDSFDPIFYTYGLAHYGNMPLVEPPETREVRRIEDFVIAVDTSMSTSGETVRRFLSCTYSILQSTQTFTRKVHIRILQCDNEVRSDQEIHDLDDLEKYMGHFQLVGGSATDFRPVFRYVDKLIAEGTFTHLRGLIYFTDGLGIYPEKRPPYETAFIMPENPATAVETPPWAIHLTLTASELKQAAGEFDPGQNQIDLKKFTELQKGGNDS